MYCVILFSEHLDLGDVYQALLRGFLVKTWTSGMHIVSLYLVKTWTWFTCIERCYAHGILRKPRLRACILGPFI